MVRTDCKCIIFGSHKVAKHYDHKWKARKIAWTLAYRRDHDKEPVVQRGQNTRRKFNMSAVRQYNGLTEEQLNQITAAREAAKK